MLKAVLCFVLVLASFAGMAGDVGPPAAADLYTATTDGTTPAVPIDAPSASMNDAADSKTNATAAMPSEELEVSSTGRDDVGNGHTAANSLALTNDTGGAAAFKAGEDANGITGNKPANATEVRSSVASSP